MTMRLETNPAEDVLSKEETQPSPQNIWCKISFHWFRDILPSLLIALIVGGLAIQVVDFIDQHRPIQTIAAMAEK